LQIALLLIGAVVVLGVLVFNWIQERRFRKQAAAAFQTPVRDALLERKARPRDDAGRIEPELREPALGELELSPKHDGLYEPNLKIESGPVDVASSRLDASTILGDARRPADAGTEAPQPEVASGSPQPLPPAMEPAPASVLAHAAPLTDALSKMTAAYVASASGAQARPVPRSSPQLGAGGKAPMPASPYDELIEYRVRIGGGNIQASLFGDAISHSRHFGKRTRWLGLPVEGDAWEEMQPWRDTHYKEVQAAMQLADRNGAAPEEDLTALCGLLQKIAQAHGLKIACDDVAQAIERAQVIDRFCVDVDVLIGLNIVARGDSALNLSKVLKEAENAGMELGADGVYQLLDNRGELLYALYNHDAEPFSRDTTIQQESQGVTLQFDVPRVPDGLKVFDSMVAFGRKLANEVGGLLVDDNLRPLTDTGIEKIRSQLTHIYERMETRGVPSGSRRALRLFS
jgi:FtsZ-interacting cell division protein ZipA